MFNILNERVRRLTAIDISLIKWAVFFATLIVVKIFPKILKINYLPLVTLVVICSIKPFYKFWIKK